MRSSLTRIVLGSARRSRAWASFREVERAEYLYYVSYLREGMTAFDVGANVGLLTLLFSHLVGTAGAVHAFEAAPEVFARLRSASEAVGAENVRLNHAAVNEHGGEVELNIYPPERLSWNTLADRPLEAGGVDVRPVARLAVPSLTLDSYCREREIERIDLLKVDVEGAELQVLRGAGRLFGERRVASCVFEFGRTTFDMGNSAEELSTYLQDKGYAVRNVIARDPVFPGGGSPRSAQFSMHVATPAGRRAQ